MKKQFVLALSAGLVVGGLTVTPAVAADPAPTNVKISWKDDTFQFIHVTWEDTGDQPNRIFVRKQGTATQQAVRHVAADAPNEIDLPAESMPWRQNTVAIGISVGTAAGETSPAAFSAEFDTWVPGPVRLLSSAPLGTGSVVVAWDYTEPVRTDPNPGDPLDREGSPVLFEPRYQVSGQPETVAAPAGTAKQFTFSGAKPPYWASIYARNEWGVGWQSNLIQTGTTQFTAKIPTWAVAGTNTVISGTYTGPEYVRATLQARNSATSPWYAVVSYDLFDHTYQFAVNSLGTRQYRVAFANAKQPSGFDVFFGGYTAAVTTTTQQKAVASPAAQTTWVGERVSADLYVKPQVNGTAQLQRWNGKAWTVVGNVALKSGFASGIIHQTTVGRTAYRYYVPAHTFNGLGVAAAYSQQFVLTTIR